MKTLNVDLRLYILLIAKLLPVELFVDMQNTSHQCKRIGFTFFILTLPFSEESVTFTSE